MLRVALLKSKSLSMLGSATIPRVEAALVGSRGLQGLRGYDEKEGAEEAVFFHKEDEKLLKKLLQKVRAQAEQHDVHNAKGAQAAEMSALDAIVGGKLSAEEKQKLIDWKHGGY